MKLKNTILLLLLCVGAFPAISQTKDEADVAATVEKLRLAMIDPTAESLKALTSPKLSYGHSGGAIDDQQIFMEKLLSGRSDFVELGFDKQTIVVSDKVAIVRHNLNAKTNDGGKPGEVHLHVMLVWQKGKSGWQLLARQAVKLQP